MRLKFFQFFILVWLISSPFLLFAQKMECKIGAADTSAYFSLIKNKKIALVVNQTSVVNGIHLVDFLQKAGFHISIIFAPEHGFRGVADAGEKINAEKDSKTGLTIASLYGKNYKPSAEQLAEVDVVIFDIQDVGARFYTYISTMHYVMEACADLKKTFVVLDRPNPNRHIIDGPILDLNLRSFVGMHPIPVVHGLTVGELALMISGEKWLSSQNSCQLFVVPCADYSSKNRYILPIKPSPNLPNQRAIVLYPSLCLLEGTMMSMGRGTDFPFQVFGHPSFQVKHFSFTPKANEGNKKPLFEGKICFGEDWRESDSRKFEFSLAAVMSSWKNTGKPKDFFTSFFDKLVGNTQIRTFIESGMKEEEIRSTWQADLEKYKQIRKKYILYED